MSPMPVNPSAPIGTGPVDPCKFSQSRYIQLADCDAKANR